jgi:hypothetical protein
MKLKVLVSSSLYPLYGCLRRGIVFGKADCTPRLAIETDFELRLRGKKAGHYLAMRSEDPKRYIGSPNTCLSLVEYLTSVHFARSQWPRGWNGAV